MMKDNDQKKLWESYSTHRTMNTPKLMSTDLFACPFCGQDDFLSTDRDGDAWEGNTYYVRCIECDVRMMGKTEQDAMRKWNFRANVEDSNE